MAKNEIIPDYEVEQDSGSVWSVYRDTKSLGYTIITAAGAELIAAEEESVRDLMRRYRDAELGRSALMGLWRRGNPIRQELGRGKEAIVYTMGEKFAVREKNGFTEEHTAISEFSRMDAINSVIEHGLPRWLNLPKHFGLLSDAKMQKTYSLMERVDNGITVEDIIDYPNLPNPQKIKTVRNELTGYIGDAKARVPELYDRAHDILYKALTDNGQNPEQFLTDWHPRNVLVEGHLITPIANSRYRLSVIDQYRA